MPNVGGPSAAKRRLQTCDVTSRFLWTAPVWAHRVLQFRVNRDSITRGLRLAVIQLTRCYRTVSTVMVLFLAKLPLGNFLARKKELIRRRRTVDLDYEPATLTAEARHSAIGEWQSRWYSETEVTSYTKRVLPSATKLTGRPSEGFVFFYLAQVLTGHGLYGEYLTIFVFCYRPNGGAPIDDVKYTIFMCPYQDEKRANISGWVGRLLCPEDIEEILCGAGLGSDPNCLALITRYIFINMVECHGTLWMLRNQRRQSASPFVGSWGIGRKRWLLKLDNQLFVCNEYFIKYFNVLLLFRQCII